MFDTPRWYTCPVAISGVFTLAMISLGAYPFLPGFPRTAGVSGALLIYILVPSFPSLGFD